MNEEAREILNKILQKEIPELQGWEKDFLRARVFYLNKKQRETFKTVLEKEDSVIQKEVTQPNPLKRTGKK